VVESVQNGVVRGRNNWNTARTKVTGVWVIGTSQSQDNTAVNWAYNRIGKPYNYNFYNMSTRSKFYCSHLIWAAYKDNFSIDLNTSKYDILGGKAIAPTELISTSKTKTIYTQNM